MNRGQIAPKLRARASDRGLRITLDLHRGSFGKHEPPHRSRTYLSNFARSYWVHRVSEPGVIQHPAAVRGLVIDVAKISIQRIFRPTGTLRDRTFANKSRIPNINTISVMASGIKFANLYVIDLLWQPSEKGLKGDAGLPGNTRRHSIPRAFQFSSMPV